MWYGVVWYGVVWCGMVRCGVVWCSMVWWGVVWCGMVRCGVVWCGVVWYDVVWCGMMWCGVVWYGEVWCGMVWCGVVWWGVWCGVVWCGVVWYRTLRVNDYNLVGPVAVCPPRDQQTRGRYHGGRRPSSDDSLHSPTVIPPLALDKPSIMKRYHHRWTCSHTSPRRSPTMVTLHDTRFVECRWWNDGWTVKTVVTWRSSASMIPAPGFDSLFRRGSSSRRSHTCDFTLFWRRKIASMNQVRWSGIFCYLASLPKRQRRRVFR